MPREIVNRSHWGGTDAGLLSRELAHGAKLTTFGGTDLVFAIGACFAE
jgi:hypothetical protein